MREEPYNSQDILALQDEQTVRHRVCGSSPLHPPTRHFSRQFSPVQLELASRCNP